MEVYVFGFNLVRQCSSHEVPKILVSVMVHTLVSSSLCVGTIMTTIAAFTITVVKRNDGRLLILA